MIYGGKEIKKKTKHENTKTNKKKPLSLPKTDM